MIAKRALKLFLFSWALSVPPVLFQAVERNDVSFYTIAEAAGFAILPFLAGLAFLIGFRNASDNGWKAAAIAALVVIALSSFGSLATN